MLELWRSFIQELPHLGTAGSRAAHLHDTASGITTATTTDVNKSKQVKRHQLTHDEMRRFIVLRLMGTFGALMLAFGALGAGALPVLENPFTFFPGGSLMTRMMQTASVVVLVGVGFMVLSWVDAAPYLCGVGDPDCVVCAAFYTGYLFLYRPGVYCRARLGPL